SERNAAAEVSEYVGVDSFGLVAERGIDVGGVGWIGMAVRRCFGVGVG
ncbi:MAG: hypothetical protein QOE33_3696, partial [Acidobacteriota bacterium]|nr:hypothetical protein [Acidobacteriota bacterium]